MGLYNTENSMSIKTIFKYFACLLECYFSHSLFTAPVKVVKYSELKFPLVEKQVRN